MMAESSARIAMPRNRIQAVAFDLDGTLANTAGDLAAAIAVMLNTLQLAPVKTDQAISWIGRGGELLVTQALKHSLGDSPPASLVKRGCAIFWDAYGKNLCHHTRLYPKVTETIHHLRQRFIVLACVTNKQESFALPLLKLLGIATDFSIIVCGDTLARKKPDPLPLIHVATALSVPLEELLMVGDSTIDVATARAAGCPVACVPYGYNQGENIADAAPDFMLHELSDLNQYL